MRSRKGILKVGNKKYVPFYSFVSRDRAYDELGIFENRGIKGYVRKRTLQGVSRYVVFLPESIK